MVWWSTNIHEIKVREHPYRVELPIPDSGWHEHVGLVREAAERFSAGQFYAWAPSRPYPPIAVYAFKTQGARDAFAAWVAEHVASFCQATIKIR